MGPQETPPASPYMEDEVIEEIDDIDDLIPDGDVEILYPDQVDENTEDGGEEMAEDEEIIEAMEREDSICIFEKHIASVFCGNLSKDARYAVTGGEDDKAYVWDAKTSEIILECTDHKDSVIFADFSHDDMYLATGDMNGVIQVRKTTDKAVIWDYNMGDATWMQWHPMAHVLIAGSVEGEVYLWKIPDGECKIVQGFGKRAETSCLMPDGKRLVVGYEDGTLRVIDLKTSTIVSTITPDHGHVLAITTIDCHLDNNLIVSAACDGRTIVSAANTGKVLSILQDLKGDTVENEESEASGTEAKGNWIEAAAFQKDISQQIAVTGTLSGDIFIWDVTKKTLRHKTDQGSGISKIIWKENSSLFFTAGLDGIVRCFDARSGECVRTFLGHTEDILDISISKDGKRLLTTSDDATARIFDIETI